MDFQLVKTRELLLELRISDVMCSQVVTIAPDAAMSALRGVLRDYGISGAPVVEDDRLVGIVSTEDLVRWLAGDDDDCSIGERMTPDPEYLFADQSVAYAIERLEDPEGYGRFPVVDRHSKKLVGIITKGDIIGGVLLKLEQEYKEEEVRQFRASHIFEDIAADYKEIYLSYDIVGKDFDRAGKASTQMKKNCKRLGIRPDIIRRLSIASYEAEMNVVIHADSGTMKYRIKPNEIVLEVSDRGPGIEDVEKAMQTGFTTSEDWVKEMGFGAGMGLSNIKNCADKMEIRSNPGVGVTLTIRIWTEDRHETE